MFKLSEVRSRLVPGMGATLHTCWLDSGSFSVQNPSPALIILATISDFDLVDKATMVSNMSFWHFFFLSPSVQDGQS
jgi:hypothetical protein